MRAFLNYAAEQEGQAAQLPRTRAPKRPRTLPRPASPEDAMGLANDAAAGASVEWIGARDLAILLLLYGAGLRVAEALSLTARVLPIGPSIRVIGKRSKIARRAGRAGGRAGDRGICRGNAPIR